MAKILYLSCHSILEFNEVKMLHELGHEVFPAGAYISPNQPHDNKRPPISGMTIRPDWLEQYNRLGQEGVDSRDCLTKEFVDNFSIVIVMHLPRWIVKNWDAIKGGRVIWRTIGQSVASVEKLMAGYVHAGGLEIVRYSPQEINIPNFAGQDALIRFYKDPEEYNSWNGKNDRIITFAQNTKDRDTACNYTLFESATRGFSRHLFGPGNEGQDWTSGTVPYEQLKQELRNNRVYFYTGTHPASYTLNFIEAWMSGIPIIAIGSQHGNARHLKNHNLYEIPNLIENGVTGLVSDNIQELRAGCKQLLGNAELAATVGAAGRAEAIKHFGKDMIYAAWKEYLGE